MVYLEKKIYTQKDGILRDWRDSFGIYFQKIISTLLVMQDNYCLLSWLPFIYLFLNLIDYGSHIGAVLWFVHGQAQLMQLGQSASMFLVNPSKDHQEVVKQIFRQLRDSSKMCMTSGDSEPFWEGYADAVTWMVENLLRILIYLCRGSCILAIQVTKVHCLAYKVL